MTVIRELMKHEGFGGFFKGLTPKILYVFVVSLSSLGRFLGFLRNSYFDGY